MLAMNRHIACGISMQNNCMTKLNLYKNKNKVMLMREKTIVLKL